MKKATTKSFQNDSVQNRKKEVAISAHLFESAPAPHEQRTAHPVGAAALVHPDGTKQLGVGVAAPALGTVVGP